MHHPESFFCFVFVKTLGSVQLAARDWRLPLAWTLRLCPGAGAVRGRGHKVAALYVRQRRKQEEERGRIRSRCSFKMYTRFFKACKLSLSK